MERLNLDGVTMMPFCLSCYYAAQRAGNAVKVTPAGRVRACSKCARLTRFARVYEPPTATVVGNMRDLVLRVCESDDARQCVFPFALAGERVGNA